MRGQTGLPALAVALLVVTTAAGLGFAIAESAIAGADREPDERRVAVALSERLVSGESPLTDRPNVLNATALSSLSATRLRTRYPVVGERAVRLRVDGRMVVDDGNSAQGSTVRRIVLVSETQERRYDPSFDATNTTTLPRRTDRIRVSVDTPNLTALHTVRANGRVVLRNRSGLDGTFTVDVSRFETTRVAFEANDTLATGDVTLTYYPARTTKATLEVTVGD